MGANGEFDGVQINIRCDEGAESSTDFFKRALRRSLLSVDFIRLFGLLDYYQRRRCVIEECCVHTLEMWGLVELKNQETVSCTFLIRDAFM